MKKVSFLSLFLFLLSASVLRAQDTLLVNSRGNPGRTGVYEVEPIDDTPVITWQDTFASSDVDAFLVGDRLFVTATEQRNQANLYALTTSGERLWSVPLTGAAMGALSYGNGLLFVGTSRGMLMAIDAENGETRWTFTRGRRVWGTPLVVEDRIYISSENGWFALEAETGEEIWHNDGCRESSSGVLSGTTLLFPCRPTTSIEALDAETGESLWSLTLEAAPAYSLAVEGNTLAATGEQSLYAIDLEAQAVMWTATTGEGLNWSGPAITEDLIIGGSIDGFMYAYDRESGELVWKFELGDWGTTDPVVIGDGVYFGFGNHFDPAVPHDFYALDAATGEVRWQFETDGMVISEASAADDRLYVTTNNGTLYALTEAE